MPDIVSERVERYIESITPERGDVLAAMEREAHRRGIPIVGPQVGRLLACLCAAVGARRIFELGSAIGYSTLWLCLGSHPRARIHYTDRSEAFCEEARVYIERAGFAPKVRFHAVPDALDALAVAPGEPGLQGRDPAAAHGRALRRRQLPLVGARDRRPRAGRRHAGPPRPQQGRHGRRAAPRDDPPDPRRGLRRNEDLVGGFRLQVGV